MKKTFRNIFLTVGLGTLIFVPMIIIDNGFNKTIISVLIWLGASILYGLSFSIFDMEKIKQIFRIPLHFITCFAITLAVRTGYSFFKNGSLHFKKLLIITLPIFIAIYILLFLYMKHFGDLSFKIKTESKDE